MKVLRNAFAFMLVSYIFEKHFEIMTLKYQVTK